MKKDPTNQKLLDRARKLAKLERRVGIEILEVFWKIEQRKAYVEEKYKGLHHFCVKGLGFTDQQARSRIDTMWATYEIPELKEKIEAGELSFTTVSKIHSHLRVQEESSGEALTLAQKAQVYESIENLTVGEVEIKIQEMRGENPTVKLLIEMNLEMKAAWDKVKGLSAHSTKGRPEQILEMLMQEWLKKNAPKPPKTKLEKVSGTETRAPNLKNDAVQDQASAPGKSTTRGRTPIPIELERQIRDRDDHECRQCTSTYATQVEHLIPVAKGGTNDPDNLILLCRNCNIHAGIREFGFIKMKRGGSSISGFQNVARKGFA